MCIHLSYLTQAELYLGAKTGDTIPALGYGGSVVMELIKNCSRTMDIAIYINNYSTSLRQFEKLGKNRHDWTAAICSN